MSNEHSRLVPSDFGGGSLEGERVVTEVAGVERVLEEAFPGYRLRISPQDVAPVQESPHIRLFSVEHSGNRVDLVLKSRGVSPRERLELRSEASCLNACAAQGIRAPRLIGIGPEYQWLLRSHVPGHRLASYFETSGTCAASKRDRVALREGLAKLVAEIHNRLHWRDNSIGWASPTLPSHELVALQLHNVTYLRAEHRRSIEPILRALAARVPQGEELVTTHGDLSGHNVIVGPNLTLTAIDWAECRVAPATAELAFVTSWGNGICRNQGEVEELLKNYQQAGGSRLNHLAFHQALDSVTQAINISSSGGNPQRLLEHSVEFVENWTGRL